MNALEKIVEEIESMKNDAYETLKEEKKRHGASVIRQIKRCRFHQIKTGLSEHLTMG